MTRIRLALVLVLLPLVGWAQGPIDPADLDKELQGEGLRGWIHGAAPEFDQYVFTYRLPDNFFVHLEFPLITTDANVKAVLRTLGRHDEVVVQGRFASLSAPIRHIRVSAITVKNKFKGDIPGVAPYQRQAQLPADLLGKTELVGKVHAVVADGKILVIEYKDAVVPVYVADASFTKDLFRNDKIRMKYEVRQHPNQPVHVSLAVDEPDPIVVTDRLVNWHGKKGTLEGALVMFPKSPQIVFNVFALQVTDADGVSREFTLVNFDDFAAFQAIRDKLQALWDGKPGTIVNGRNKFVNPGIRIRASGTFNVVDPSQANPQILLDSELDVVALP